MKSKKCNFLSVVRSMVVTKKLLFRIYKNVLKIRKSKTLNKDPSISMSTTILNSIHGALQQVANSCSLKIQMKAFLNVRNVIKNIACHVVWNFIKIKLAPSIESPIPLGKMMRNF